MISQVQANIKKLIDVTFQPSEWTLDDPAGLINSTRAPRTAFQSPVLKSSMQIVENGQIEVKYLCSYQVAYRFPSSLKYGELPMKIITDLMAYLNFILVTHPGLLEGTTTDIDDMLAWTHRGVDPCLFEPKNKKIDVTNVEVNSFIPIVEKSSTDWIIMINWSLNVSIKSSVANWRNYFMTNLPSINPNLIGGSIGPVIRLGLQLWKSPNRKAHPNPIIVGPKKP